MLEPTPPRFMSLFTGAESTVIAGEWHQESTGATTAGSVRVCGPQPAGLPGIRHLMQHFTHRCSMCRGDWGCPTSIASVLEEEPSPAAPATRGSLRNRASTAGTEIEGQREWERRGIINATQNSFLLLRHSKAFPLNTKQRRQTSTSVINTQSQSSEKSCMKPEANHFHPLEGTWHLRPSSEN